MKPGVGGVFLGVGASPIKASDMMIGGEELGGDWVTGRLEEEAGGEVFVGAGSDSLVWEEQREGGRDDGGWFYKEEVCRVEGRVA